MIRVTIDTTTLVSGFLRPEPPPGRLLVAWRQRLFTLVTAAPLLDEVGRTFRNPYFARRLSPAEAQDNLALLRSEAVIVATTVMIAGVATHPEDDVMLATALSGEAQFVVTSDHGLLRLGSYRELVIVSAAQFLAMLPGLVQADEPS